MDIEKILFGLTTAVLGALAAYSLETLKRRRSNYDDLKALKKSIAAEIYCNLELVLERIDKKWSELDQGAEHIPAFGAGIQSEIFNNARTRFGLLDPELSAQIIYFYARLHDIVAQDKLNDACTDSIGDTIATHRLLLKRTIDKTNYDGLEIIRDLHGRGIGEYDCTYGLSPHRHLEFKSRSLRTSQKYLDETNRFERMRDTLISFLRK